MVALPCLSSLLTPSLPVGDSSRALSLVDTSSQCSTLSSLFLALLPLSCLCPSCNLSSHSMPGKAGVEGQVQGIEAVKLDGLVPGTGGVEKAEGDLG